MEQNSQATHGGIWEQMIHITNDLWRQKYAYCFWYQHFDNSNKTFIMKVLPSKHSATATPPRRHCDVAETPERRHYDAAHLLDTDIK